MKHNKVFDTSVQLLKYNVLKEVVRHAYDGTLDRAYIDIPKTISQAPKPSSVAASTRSVQSSRRGCVWLAVATRTTPT